MPTTNCDLNGWWPPGCGLVSQANEGIMGAITSMFSGLLENIASWIWSFITGAFSVSDVDNSQWTSIQGLTDWWIVVMMTPLVIAIILQLLSGLISQQPRQIVRAFVGGAVAVPMVAGAVYLVRQLTKVSDSASTALLDTMGTDPYVVFMRLFGFERAPADSGRAWNVISLGGAWAAVPSGGGVTMTVMATLIIWILAFILMCSMIFRSFALIVLAAVAPVALMLMPWQKTKSWAGRWCEIVVALLLAKPLAATVLAVAIRLFAHSTSFAGLAAGATGMLLACAAPLMTLRLVSFAGGELAAAAQVAGGGHILARGSSIASRQIGRQMGGRLTLASLAGRRSMTTPVPSSRPPMGTQVLASPTRPGPATPATSLGVRPPTRDGGTAAILDGGRPAARATTGKNGSTTNKPTNTTGPARRPSASGPTGTSGQEHDMPTAPGNPGQAAKSAGSPPQAPAPPPVPKSAPAPSSGAQPYGQAGYPPRKIESSSEGDFND